MKKLFALLLTLSLVFALSACGEKETSSNDEKSTPTSQTETVNENSDETVVDDVTTSDTEDDLGEDGEITKTEAEKPSNKETDKNNNKKPVNNSKEETKTEKEEEKKLYFYNDTIDGRWTVDSISVVAREAYFENGNLVLHAYIVNGYSTNATNVNIKQIIVLDKNGEQIAHAYFGSQNLSIAPLSYVTHTFTFGADTIISTDVDMSALAVNSQFQANH